MRQYALGIDLGGTGTKFGLVDESGQVLRSDSIPSQQYPDIVEYCDVLCAGLKRLVEAEGLTMGDLAGIGCGAPDANFYTGCIEQATNLPWKGVVPLAKLISERMGVKCTVTNDANAAAQGEMIYGSARVRQIGATDAAWRHGAHYRLRSSTEILLRIISFE